MDSIKDIEDVGIKAKGKRELIRHLQGERLTMRQAILAKCFDCMGGYCEGKVDCKIPGCSLYEVMPYRENKEVRPKKERTEKQMSSADRLAFMRHAARRKRG
jgi:hypothetical protein